MDDNNTTLSREQVAEIAALEVIELIERKPQAALGLPTGRTPIDMYSALVRLSRERGVDWSGVQCFALDEYLEVEKDKSFAAFLDHHLYGPLSISGENTHSPVSEDDYDSLIALKGGLDLTILGIGGNGHVAFNEPGTSASSWTHCVWLTEETRIANQKDFEGKAVPTRGVSIGIATILASRSILLLATGEKKRSIIDLSFGREQKTTDIPASLLQGHEGLTVLTDFGFGCRICSHEKTDL